MVQANKNFDAMPPLDGVLFIVPLPDRFRMRSRILDTPDMEIRWRMDVPTLKTLIDDFFSLEEKELKGLRIDAPLPYLVPVYINGVFVRWYGYSIGVLNQPSF